MSVRMRLLIVDDEAPLRAAIRRLLRRVEDLEIVEASSLETALAAAAEDIDLMLLDLRLSADAKRGGLELLRELRRLGREVPAVIVTSSTALDDLREAMRLGARDYVLKDELCEELVVPIVTGFRERLALKGEVQELRARIDGDFGVNAIVGSSPQMEKVRRTIARVADADAPVLLLGETGTGKELVAQAIHQTSARRDEPFVAVNCSALPSTLIESLLFGHEKGAFTGADKKRRGRVAAAGKGTLLLDEIGDLPIDLQVKLLRVLEENKYLPLGADKELPLEARVIAATNADLTGRAQAGTFRRDLLFRLDVLTIRLPKLEDRADDLAELVTAFTASLPRKLRFTSGAMEWLATRRWPGNVRELRNVLRRISIMADDDLVDVPTLVDLAPGDASAQAAGGIEALIDAVLGSDETAEGRYVTVERALLRRALDQTHGNLSAAARLLGMPRKVLVRRWTRLSGAAMDDEQDDE